jgi:hypothetical protein
MSGELIVHRNRTNRVPLGLGFPVNGDVITSEIREHPGDTGAPLATWTVTYATDGSDGEIILTLLPSQLTTVTVNYGYMDLKRVSGGQPLSVFLEPLKVHFQGVVTL